MSDAAKHERFEGERTLMRIHIGESDRWHGKPLYEAIVELLRRDKFSGATVLRGVGGYGARAFTTRTKSCASRRICRSSSKSSNRPSALNKSCRASTK